MVPKLMSLIYRISFHIAKTKNQSKFFMGVGVGIGVVGVPELNCWRKEPQGKLEP